jgi:hypothetical protein
MRPVLYREVKRKLEAAGFVQVIKWEATQSLPKEPASEHSPPRSRSIVK